MATQSTIINIVAWVKERNRWTSTCSDAVRRI